MSQSQGPPIHVKQDARCILKKVRGKPKRENMGGMNICYCGHEADIFALAQVGFLRLSLRVSVQRRPKTSPDEKWFP